MVQPMWNIVWKCVIQLNIFLPYKSAVALLVHLPKEAKNRHVYTKTYMWIFIVHLLEIAKSSRQPRCPLVGKRINKLCYFQAVKYYPTNLKISCQTMKWHGEKLECTLLSEWSQSEKATYFFIPIVWNCGKSKNRETVKRSVVARGWREGDT